MKICIPTEDDKGLAAKAFGHFGSAPFFTIVDTDSGDLETVRNSGQDHPHGQCRPTHRMGEWGVDAVVVQGLGRRAFGFLKEAGIDVLVTDRQVVGDIVQAARAGEMRPLSVDEACGGHGHGHGREGCR